MFKVYTVMAIGYWCDGLWDKHTLPLRMYASSLFVLTTSNIKVTGKEDAKWTITQDDEGLTCKITNGTTLLAETSTFLD